MGRLGRYIDSLTPEQKDRVIEGQGWKTGDFGDNYGNRCLVGHAFMCDSLEEFYKHGGTDHFLYFDGCRCIGFVGSRFDRYVHRFGKNRVVRACKLRAAKPQPVLQPAEQPSCASAGLR